MITGKDLGERFRRTILGDVLYDLDFGPLTLIVKSWKTHPENYQKFSISGSWPRPFAWKTYPTFFEISILGSWARPFTWKTHPLKNHEYLFSCCKYWVLSKNVLLENSSMSGWVFQSNGLYNVLEFSKYYFQTKCFVLDEFSSTHFPDICRYGPIWTISYGEFSPI